MSFRINLNAGPLNQIQDTNSVPPPSIHEEKQVPLTLSVPPIPEREDFRYKPTPVQAYIPAETTPVRVPRSSQPLVEKDKIIYDKTTKQWRLIKESEAYRYTF